METEFEARSCGGGQEFSAFGFISFLLIMMNFSANVVNNMNANSNDNNNNNNNNNDNNNNNNLNMNTVGRRFKPESYENYFEDQLIKDLVDNSMNWEIDSKNFLDHSMIKASMLTNQYVKSMKKWNTDFCDSLICNILEI